MLLAWALIGERLNQSDCLYHPRLAFCGQAGCFFTPLDVGLFWDVSRALKAIKGFTFVFGSHAHCEACLFAVKFWRLGACHLLHTGCMAKHVENSAAPTP